ncbi:MAG: hypothetical protein ACREXX_19255 [Gammaproteobacteria bacterium]
MNNASALRFERLALSLGLLFISLSPVNAAVSLDLALGHRGDFLTNPDCPRGTTGYVNATTGARDKCRAGIKRKGYTHHYVSITSYIKNFYADPVAFKSRLQELVNDGIKPVVFLTSDTGAWKDKSISAIKSDLTGFVPKIDGLVSSYALGIEIDEYWTASEAKAIGDHLQTITFKKIAGHQLPGRWNYCKGHYWCDYMILQYGFGKSESAVKSMTENAITDLHRPVVAGEYNTLSIAPETQSVKLGNAAVSVGAVGFGNGGGAFQPPPNTQPKVVIDWVSTGKAYALGHAEVLNGSPYVDRTFTIASLSATLDGGTMIRTANDDKNVMAAAHLKFTLAQPAAVYVAYSGAATVRPAWLTGWTLTTEKFDLTDTGSNPRKVYKKAFSAGQVSLGGNRASPAAGPSGYSNYVVVVR